MKKCFLLLILLFSASAFADEECEYSLPQWYMRALGGWNYIDSPSENGVTLDYDTGFFVGGALGFRILPFLRVESEIAYRENHFNQLEIDGFWEIPLGGRISTWTYMGNVLIDLPLEGFLKPFIGAGAGYMQEEGFIDTSALAEALGFDTFLIKGSGFAWQIIGGISCEIFPKTELKIEYHYLDGEHMDTNHSIGFTLLRYF